MIWTLANTHDWLWQAMTSRLSLICLAVMAGCVLALAACGRVCWVIRGRSARRRSLASDQEGTAAVEFILVLPVALFVILLLAQTTFLFSGNLYVHYAALAATRAAIVQIPVSPDDAIPSTRNVYIAGEGNAKHDLIRRAAVVAVWPVSGAATEGTTPTDDILEGLRAHFTAYDKEPPAWIDNLAADRLRYADANTTIKVMPTDVITDNGQPTLRFTELADGATHTFGPKDAITVRVTHNFSLTVPIVRAVYASSSPPTASASARYVYWQNAPREAYTVITAQYTLSNEGVDPELPPAPELPREP